MSEENSFWVTQTERRPLEGWDTQHRVRSMNQRECGRVCVCVWRCIMGPARSLFMDPHLMFHTSSLRVGFPPPTSLKQLISGRDANPPESNCRGLLVLFWATDVKGYTISLISSSTVSHLHPSSLSSPIFCISNYRNHLPAFSICCFHRNTSQ